MEVHFFSLTWLARRVSEFKHFLKVVLMIGVMIVHTSATHEFPVHVSYHDPFRFSRPCVAISKNHIKIRMLCLNEAF